MLAVAAPRLGKGRGRGLLGAERRAHARAPPPAPPLTRRCSPPLQPPAPVTSLPHRIELDQGVLGAVDVLVERVGVWRQGGKGEKRREARWAHGRQQRAGRHGWGGRDVAQQWVEGRRAKDLRGQRPARRPGRRPWRGDRPWCARACLGSAGATAGAVGCMGGRRTTSCFYLVLRSCHIPPPDSSPPPAPTRASRPPPAYPPSTHPGPARRPGALWGPPWRLHQRCRRPAGPARRRPSSLRGGKSWWAGRGGVWQHGSPQPPTPRRRPARAHMISNGTQLQVPRAACGLAAAAFRRAPRRRLRRRPHPPCPRSPTTPAPAWPSASTSQAAPGAWGTSSPSPSSAPSRVPRSQPARRGGLV